MYLNMCFFPFLAPFLPQQVTTSLNIEFIYFDFQILFDEVAKEGFRYPV